MCWIIGRNNIRKVASDPATGRIDNLSPVYLPRTRWRLDMIEFLDLVNREHPSFCSWMLLILRNACGKDHLVSGSESWSLTATSYAEEFSESICSIASILWESSHQRRTHPFWVEQDDLPFKISGASYPSVPRDHVGFWIGWEWPKSISRTVPLLQHMLLGLRSQYNRPAFSWSLMTALIQDKQNCRNAFPSRTSSLWL